MKEGKKMQYTTHIERKNGDDNLKEDSKLEKSGSHKKLEDTLSFDQIEEAKLPINKFYDSKILDQTEDKISKQQENFNHPEGPPEKDMFFAMPVKQKIAQPVFFTKEKKPFDLPTVKDKPKETQFEKKNNDFFNQLKMIGN